MDPETLGTGALVVGGGYFSKDIINKLLGPTADYLGTGAKNLTEKAFNNVGKIFQVAWKRLGAGIDTPGQVPPRVLKEVLNEGAFCEDEVMIEYFGGVLASSRSGVSRDDRGARFAAMIGRLSTYQVRAHFVFYSLIKKLFDGSGHSISTEDGRDALRIFLSFEAFQATMELSRIEERFGILSHVVLGLEAEGLLAPNYTWGAVADFQRRGIHHIDRGGLAVMPSGLGAELFFWAHGVGSSPLYKFLQKDFDLPSEIALNVTSGVRALAKDGPTLDDILASEEHAAADQVQPTNDAGVLNDTTER